MAGKGKSRKLSVTLPRDLVAEVQATVPKGGVSSFLAQAAEHYLLIRRQREALEKGFGAWKDEDHPDLASPEDSIAYVRALREAGDERVPSTRGSQ